MSNMPFRLFFYLPRFILCLPFLLVLNAGCGGTSTWSDEELFKMVDKAELYKTIDEPMILGAEKIPGAFPEFESRSSILFEDRFFLLAQTEPEAVAPETFLLPEEPSWFYLNPTPKYLYHLAIKCVLEGKYEEALEKLDEVLETLSHQQAYGVEASILRLIILGALRAGYLKLGNAYTRGWERVLREERKDIPIEERIKRLTNLSRASLTYYRRHKRAAVRMLQAYDTFMKFYPALSSDSLKLLFPPLKDKRFTSEVLKGKITSGEWPDSTTRSQVEETILSNSFLAFFLSALGVNNTSRADRLLKSYKVILDDKGFFAWLEKSFTYHPKPFRLEAFSDEPEMVRFLKDRAQESRAMLKELLARGEKSTFKAAPYNPEKFLK